MKIKQPFSTAISNKEHLVKAQEVFENEVQPKLAKNEEAYQKYIQNKDS